MKLISTLEACTIKNLLEDILLRNDNTTKSAIEEALEILETVLESEDVEYEVIYDQDADGVDDAASAQLSMF